MSLAWAAITVTLILDSTEVFHQFSMYSVSEAISVRKAEDKCHQRE